MYFLSGRKLHSCLTTYLHLQTYVHISVPSRKNSSKSISDKERGLIEGRRG